MDGKIKVRVADGEAEGLDTDGGRWQVICETHGAIVSVESRQVARDDARAARQEGRCESCEDCMAQAWHEDAEIRALYERRRVAASNADNPGQYGAGWARLEAIEAELRERDPQGEWITEGYDWNAGRWVCDRSRA
jgi:hypothetical protein